MGPGRACLPRKQKRVHLVERNARITLRRFGHAVRRNCRSSSSSLRRSESENNNPATVGGSSTWTSTIEIYVVDRKQAACPSMRVLRNMKLEGDHLLGNQFLKNRTPGRPSSTCFTIRRLAPWTTTPMTERDCAFKKGTSWQERDWLDREKRTTECPNTLATCRMENKSKKIFSFLAAPCADHAIATHFKGISLLGRSIIKTVCWHPFSTRTSIKSVIL
jgi:hypothetical protein